MALATWGMMTEEYYEKPQDIEWAKDGDRQTCIVQSDQRQSARGRITRSLKYELKKKGEAIATGIAIDRKSAREKCGSLMIHGHETLKRRSAGDAHHRPDRESIAHRRRDCDEQGERRHARRFARIGVPCMVGTKCAQTMKWASR